MLRNIWDFVVGIYNYITFVPETPARVALTTTTETVLISSKPGQRIVVIGLFGSNEHATLLTRVDLRNGLTGSIIYSVAMAALGGGFTHQPNHYWRLDKGKDLTVQLSVAATAYVTAEYYWET